MKCAICGASCRCRRAKGGICCSCHKHKVRLNPATRQPFHTEPQHELLLGPPVDELLR